MLDERSAVRIREIRCTAFPLDCSDSSKKIQNDVDVAAEAKAPNATGISFA